MKIAFFHELHKGGALRAVREYAKWMSKENSIDLYSTEISKPGDDNGVFNKVYQFKFSPKLWSGHNWKTRIFKDTVELYNLNRLHKRIASCINNGNYDCVVVFPSQYTQAPFILKFIKIKKIYCCFEPLRLVYDPVLKIPENIGTLRTVYEKISRQLRKTIDYKNVNHADSYIVPSKYISSIFKSVYKKTAEIVYCGVDTDFFSSTNLRRDIDLLYIGSSDQLSGFKLFEDSVNNIKYKTNVRIILFEQEWLSDLALRDIYRRTKILIATSCNEPLGLIPLEAMSCGACVIAVDEGGYKETVMNNYTGYLVPRDKRKIIQAIDQLITNNKTMRRFSDNGIKIMAKDWSWKKRSLEFEMAIKNSKNVK